MKKVIYLCCIALAVMACKPKEEPAVEPTVEPIVEAEVVTSNPYDTSITGTCVRGEVPQWTVDAKTTYSSMSLILDQYGVPCLVNENDQLSAFVGTSCRGVAKPFKDASNKWRFNLLVKASSSDMGEVQVELRYYSAANQGTYTSQSIAYSDGAILGTILKGYQPTWK